MGQICCGGTCVDPLTSEQHCGECGRACGANETCMSNGMGGAVCVCGNNPSNDPVAGPGGGAACTGAMPVCCDEGTPDDDDDVCAANPSACP